MQSAISRSAFDVSGKLAQMNAAVGRIKFDCAVNAGDFDAAVVRRQLQIRRARHENFIRNRPVCFLASAFGTNGRAAFDANAASDCARFFVGRRARLNTGANQNVAAIFAAHFYAAVAPRIDVDETAR